MPCCPVSKNPLIVRGKPTSLLKGKIARKLGQAGQKVVKQGGMTIRRLILSLVLLLLLLTCAFAAMAATPMTPTASGIACTATEKAGVVATTAQEGVVVAICAEEGTIVGRTQEAVVEHVIIAAATEKSDNVIADMKTLAPVTAGTAVLMAAIPVTSADTGTVAADTVRFDQTKKTAVEHVVMAPPRTVVAANLGAVGSVHAS